MLNYFHRFFSIKKYALMQRALLYVFLLIPFSSQANENEAVNKVLDQFHVAAAQANFSDYFSLLSEDAIFLGTDAKERWTKQTFKEYVKPYFDKGQGWTYEKITRNISKTNNGNIVFFDELLSNSFYGTCRGSGIMVKQQGEWRISQYSLSVMVPNEISKTVVGSIKNHENNTMVK